MKLPLYPYETISSGTNLFFALLLGVLFGLVLERGGLGNAKKLIGQFLLKDLTVFKVMFSAIVTAALGLFFLSVMGIINLELIDFSESYLLPQALGGLLLGAGFAFAGYCPGTTLVGMASGKIDALYCFVGLFIGSWIFSLVFDGMVTFYYSTYLENDRLPDVFNLSSGSVIFIVVLIAIGGFWLSEKVEAAHE